MTVLGHTWWHCNFTLDGRYRPPQGIKPRKDPKNWLPAKSMRRISQVSSDGTWWHKEACLEVVTLIFRRIQFTNKFQSHSCEVIINSCWLTGVHVINFCKERWLPQRTFRHWMPANNAELWRLFIVNYNIWHWTRFCCREKWTMKRIIQPSMDYHRKLKLETWMLNQNPAF